MPMLTAQDDRMQAAAWTLFTFRLAVRAVGARRAVFSMSSPLDGSNDAWDHCIDMHTGINRQDGNIAACKRRGVVPAEGLEPPT